MSPVDWTSTPPAEPPRTSVLRGVSEADVLRQAEADAAEGRRRGYEPVHQEWSETNGLKALTITYHHRYAPEETPPGWTQPASAGAAAASESHAKMGGIAWLVSAAFLAALAVGQWNSADAVKALQDLGTSLGIDYGLKDLRPYAAWNGLQAGLIAILGVKLVRYPTKGLASWSTAAAVLTVLAGVVQPNALANITFLGSICAALVAGVLVWMARDHLI